MNRNSFLFGALYGFVTPIVGFFFWRLIFQLLSSETSEAFYGLASLWDFRTVCLLAIASNIIFVQLFRRRRFFESMRGIMVVIGLFAIAWFIYFRETFFVS